MKYWKSTFKQEKLCVYRKDDNFYYIEGYDTKRNEWRQMSFSNMADLDRIFYNNLHVSEEITKSEADRLIMALELCK